MLIGLTLSISHTFLTGTSVGTVSPGTEYQVYQTLLTHVTGGHTIKTVSGTIMHHEE